MLPFVISPLTSIASEWLCLLKELLLAFSSCNKKCNGNFCIGGICILSQVRTWRHMFLSGYSTESESCLWAMSLIYRLIYYLDCQKSWYLKATLIPCRGACFNKSVASLAMQLLIQKQNKNIIRKEKMQACTRFLKSMKAFYFCICICSLCAHACLHYLALKRMPDINSANICHSEVYISCCQ